MSEAAPERILPATESGDENATAVTFALRMDVRWKSGAREEFYPVIITEEIATIFYAAGDVDVSEMPLDDWFTAETIKGIFIFNTANGMRSGDTFYLGDNIINLGDVSGMTVHVMKN